MASRWKERAPAALLAGSTLAAGVGVRSGLVPPLLAKYAGVALWCALVYWLVLFLGPRLSPLRACAISIAIGWAVEFAQLTPGPKWLASVLPLSRWVFGTTFNAPDLAAYILGAVAAAGMHRLLCRWQVGRPGLEPGTSRM